MCSCEETQSYSDLLNEEEKAVNWWLSQHNVSLNIPADSIFVEGSDLKAPFYKMNEDGTIYMQVVSKGDMSNRPQTGDRIYFRFMRQNIKTLFNSGAASWNGNSQNMAADASATSILFNKSYLQSTTQFGTGIQLPLYYLGDGCEVNIVIKSREGFSDDEIECNPYIYNIRYFKAIY